MGALRFKQDPMGEFQNNDKKHAAPPWASLAELVEASLRLEDSQPDQETKRWIDLLIAPGSSLGGARPKASVLDKQKNLWIAKFPSHSDDVDKGRWEHLAHKIALRSGIVMSESKSLTFGNRHHTFLTKRFDRSASQSRIHFASAMTLLGYTDGNGSDGASYLNIAEFIAAHGAAFARV
jgi:serine/threonine-protein kinase HipA